jgi:uncharacterized phage protein (predicted DNA packaging)
MVPLAFPGRVSIAAPLVLLADMKAHLRITDTAHDADVTAISASAQDAILASLAAAADATWTDTTVPKTVAHAIKVLTAHYYENRFTVIEDEPRATTDAEVWAALGRLLAYYRDPTVA